MPGEFYIEGKKEKVNITEILTKIDELLKLRRSTQSGDKVMTADYQAVYEQSSEYPYIFAGAKIDLTPMEAADTIDVRVRTRLDEGGDLVVVDEKTYTGVQPDHKKAIRIGAMPDRYGFEIAMRQTAGVLKTITCEFFDAKR
jgi:hypothetical protein